ncbi:GMC family oxidoreductase [Sphingomonas sp.]|uniref:GMC family oxidoreductase n=1 Tax=Sphingomonas sp. TaxID=28214 RepID=UPI00286E1285|nr:GMC family oxidoreductase [Sphingomonas sp.]
MHIDLEQTELATLNAEVCIVGTGAAGISLARGLLARGHSVTLLESGGFDYEPRTAALNAGGNIGLPYYELEHARLRFFGGTTAIWGGRVAELDPIDFETRDWVPHSGWPLAYDELKPFYAEAWRALDCDIPSAADQPLGPGVPLPEFDADKLAIRLWAFDPRANRFVHHECRDLADDPRCTIVTHATVTEIVPADDGGSVQHLLLTTFGRRQVKVHARAFVLAAGGIENPRLLLASRRLSDKGLGNSHDLVGRFFMEHPHARGGRVETKRSWGLLNAFGRSHRVAGRRLAALIAASDQRQRDGAMLNTSLTLAPRQPADATQFFSVRAYNRVKHDLPPTRLSRAVWRKTKHALTSLQTIVDPLRPWLLHKMGAMELSLLVRAEQAPNPDSRVTLTGDTDALGMPRVALDWRLSELDKHSVKQLVDTVGSELGRLGLGSAEPAPWLSDPDRDWHFDPLVSAHPIGGYHHIGTTRMADSPRRGVCDGSGQVHGVHNLFVAGSSLFPTSGWANPTLTLMALAYRTAGVVSRRLQHPQAAGRHIRAVS